MSKEVQIKLEGQLESKTLKLMVLKEEVKKATGKAKSKLTKEFNRMEMERETIKKFLTEAGVM